MNEKDIILPDPLVGDFFSPEDLYAVDVTTITDLVNKAIQKRVMFNVKRLRKEKGMTQKELAEKSGMNVAGIGALETNPDWVKKTSLKMCRRLAKGFDMDLLDLVNEIMTPLKNESRRPAVFIENLFMPEDIGEYPTELIRKVTCEDVPTNKINLQAFYKMVDDLEPMDKFLVQMRFLDRASYRTIGEIAGISYERVRQRIEKCVEEMRAHPEAHNLIFRDNSEYNELRKELENYRAIMKILKEAEIEIEELVSNNPNVYVEFKSEAETPLDIAGLSRRSLGALKRAGYKTIQEVASAGRKIKEIRGLGTKSLKEIEQILRDKFGIKL